MSIDSKAFKSALSRWGSGVCVITARHPDGRLGGLTATSFTSVSLDPPLILFCLGNGATSFDVFQGAGGFVVHVLATGQEALSGHFANSQEDKFQGLDYAPGRDGAPVLPGCMAVLECSTQQKIPAGDHVIMVGRVESAQENEAEPLMYYRGQYHSL